MWWNPNDAAEKEKKEKYSIFSRIGTIYYLFGTLRKTSDNAVWMFNVVIERVVSQRCHTWTKVCSVGTQKETNFGLGRIFSSKFLLSKSDLTLKVADFILLGVKSGQCWTRLRHTCRVFTQSARLGARHWLSDDGINKWRLCQVGGKY